MSPRVGDVHNDWQGKCTRTQQRVAQLYHVGDWTDCSFKLGKEIVKGHKLILSMASPVFAKMFFGKTEANDPVVVDIEEINADAFLGLLEYIYTDEVKINGDSLEEACNIYYAAKKYKLLRLMMECYRYIDTHLCPDNVCQAYEFSNIHDDTVLRDKCVKIFCEETLDVLKSPNFKKASEETVKFIITMDKLNIHNELDLFKALAKYGQGMREREMERERLRQAEENEESSSEEEESSSSSSNDSSSAQSRASSAITFQLNEPNDDAFDEVDAFIRSLLYSIRFLSLKPHEFAECKFLRTLLTFEEILAIGMNIASRFAYMKMPDGFCRSRIARNLDDKDQPTVVFRSVVHNVKKLVYYESEMFYTKNVPWYISIKPVYKSIRGVLTKAFAVFLFCCLVHKPDWYVRVYYEFRLTSSKPSAGKMPSFKIDHLFSSKKKHCGCTVRWDCVMDPNNMEDGAISYEVRIVPEDPILSYTTT